jgi:LCP family protein required for cell wall assembly
MARNILLLGSDSRGILAGGRSDVIVVVHISSDRKNVYLVHFPRDMYVEVPGHDKNKINAAYAYGGPQLLVRMPGKLVDVPIDHVAVIGFDGFKAMTDAAGGSMSMWRRPATSTAPALCMWAGTTSMVRLRLGSRLSCTSSTSATFPEDVAGWPP